MQFLPTSPLALLRVILVFVLPAIVVGWVMIRMPGKTFRASPPPLTSREEALRDELRADVRTLAVEIGERNMEHYPQLAAAADFIERSFSEAGLRREGAPAPDGDGPPPGRRFFPRRDSYDVAGRSCANIELEIPGSGPEIIVIGAHYDSVSGSPGANDNGSGVAAVLALARRFAARPPGVRTLRFVAFANEEPGYFQTEKMGSWVYAQRCKAKGDQIVGMISLETIGYFSNAPGSQKFPMLGLKAVYPSTGNFIAFVGNIASGDLLRQALGTFRQHATLPSEGAALPAAVSGVGWSDHWAFWQHGYPAIMVTDTAPFRYPHYHARSDTPEKLDYEAMARLVNGFEAVVDDLANPGREEFNRESMFSRQVSNQLRSIRFHSRSFAVWTRYNGEGFWRLSESRLVFRQVWVWV